MYGKRYRSLQFSRMVTGRESDYLPYRGVSIHTHIPLPVRYALCVTCLTGRVCLYIDIYHILGNTDAPVVPYQPSLFGERVNHVVDLVIIAYVTPTPTPVRYMRMQHTDEMNEVSCREMCV